MPSWRGQGQLYRCVRKVAKKRLLALSCLPIRPSVCPNVTSRLLPDGTSRRYLNDLIFLNLQIPSCCCFVSLQPFRINSGKLNRQVKRPANVFPNYTEFTVKSNLCLAFSQQTSWLMEVSSVHVSRQKFSL